tara:strand:+ start:4371 stop:4742 length:372 start_codon:yes stop_codon:yes gene_type:complete
MAQTKVNPVYVDEEKFFIGLKPTFFEVGFGAAVNAKTGPDSTIQTVIHAILNENLSILGMSALYDTNQTIAFMVDGEKGTDTYDGSNSETLAVHLEDVIQALGTVDSINLASATVTAKTFALA